MKLRELRGDDVFTILALLGKLELKDELVKAYEEGMTGSSKKLSKADIEARGVRVMAALAQQVLRNINVVRDDVIALLADLTGKSTEEIRDLKAAEFVKLVISVFKNPDIQEVFTSAASLLTDQPATETAAEPASTS